MITTLALQMDLDGLSRQLALAEETKDRVHWRVPRTKLTHHSQATGPLGQSPLIQCKIRVTIVQRNAAGLIGVLSLFGGDGALLSRAGVPLEFEVAGRSKVVEFRELESRQGLVQSQVVDFGRRRLGI